MRLPLSWLAEAAGLADGLDPADVARRLTAAGLEVESVEAAGQDISEIGRAHV